jgi:hypothetical protein
VHPATRRAPGEQVAVRPFQVRLTTGDITDVATREVGVQRAGVVELCSRDFFVLTIDRSPRAALIADALPVAIDCPRPDGTLIHSDPATFCTSWAVAERDDDSAISPGT